MGFYPQNRYTWPLLPNTSKLDGEPITLTEGDLYNIDDIVCKVTREALQEEMIEQQNVLGALRA